MVTNKGTKTNTQGTEALKEEPIFLGRAKFQLI